MVIEKYNYKENKYKLKWKDLTNEFDGYHIIHITDVHAGRLADKNEKYSVLGNHDYLNYKKYKDPEFLKNLEEMGFKVLNNKSNNISRQSSKKVIFR